MMRLLALVLGVVSIAGVAQSQEIKMLKEDSAPPPPVVLQGATADTVTVPQNVLRALAESEPDISARDEAPQPSVVLVKVLVSKTGMVEEAVVVQGQGELPRVAVAGVKGWKYRPYVVDGEAREIQSTIPLQFRDGVGRRAVMVAGMAGMGSGVAGMAGMGTGSGTGQGSAMLGGPVRVPSGVIAGMLEQPVAPAYPPIAKAAHVQGVVVLHAVISTAGEIEDLQVVSGPPMLRQAAVDAVRQWKYRPYVLNGVATEVQTTINVNFTFAAPPKAAPADGEGSGDTPTSGSPVGDGRVRVSSGEMAGMLLENRTPLCSAPVESHASGVVVLRAIVSKEGAVKDVQVVSAAKSLEECSLAAVRGWRYKPYLLDGVPKEVETTIVLSMNFGGPASPADAK
jgi:TonB family protein